MESPATFMSEENKSAAVISERSETENARLAAEPEEKMPWDTYDQELGIAPVTGHQSPVTEIPHVAGSTEAKENLQELQEENTAIVRGSRWLDPNEVGEAREDERFGRILHASHFLEMLRRTGFVGVYTKCQAARGLRHLGGAEKTKEAIAKHERTTAGLVTMGTASVQLVRPQYVTWIQIPWMIEYSVMRFDAHGLATTEKYRGWRTVGIELIRQGYVSEAEFNRVFGEARGPAAQRWGEIMQAIRSN